MIHKHQKNYIKNIKDADYLSTVNVFHYKEIFMFCFLSGRFCYCPIIKTDLCVISWKKIFLPKFH